AHEGFKAAFENIEKHLENPPKGDMANFIGFCESFVAIIEHHHNTEEETLFPELNTKMDFHGEQEQHKAIHDFLHSFADILTKAKPNPQSLDIAAIKQLMAGAKQNLYTHLDQEVDHITGENIRAAGFTDKEVQDMLKRMDEFIMKGVVMSRDLPFICCVTKPQANGKAFPPLPWFIRKIVLPFMLVPIHSGWWKYGPYKPTA
ncbi:hypothetical protein K488DRAFT_49746, partial [Vararia minispora EC-137]